MMYAIQVWLLVIFKAIILSSLLLFYLVIMFRFLLILLYSMVILFMFLLLCYFMVVMWRFLASIPDFCVIVLILSKED